MRLAVALLLVCGCDKVFSTSHVDPPPPIDAPTDAAPDAPPVDAPSPAVAGCADGTREWLVSLAGYPSIAGCSGTWAVPGLHNAPPATPICPGNGNDRPSLDGNCEVSDLCTPGWHVCNDDADVKTSLQGKACHESSGLQDVFFVTRQHSTGLASCETVGSNDLLGCGSIGIVTASSCLVLERASNDSCFTMPGVWDCGNNFAAESDNVTKPSNDGGGVLCCKGP